jgi:hypothetical protein
MAIFFFNSQKSLCWISQPFFFWSPSVAKISQKKEKILARFPSLQYL